MSTDHVYRTELDWSGSTGAGYRGYSREHRIVTPPAVDSLHLSADPHFRGDPDRSNPEQLLLAAASSCQLLAFLALAARDRVDVRRYDDTAEAVMPADSQPMRITRIELRPRIVVAPGTDVGRVEKLVAAAHEECYVANTLACEVAVEPEITTSDRDERSAPR